ncbi:MAG: hypothetical protein AAF415_17255 [Pseudomonadota bacterium]
MSVHSDRSVLLIDDQTLTYFLLEPLLTRDVDRLLLATTETDAIQLVFREKPTVVIVNLTAPTMQVVELSRTLRERHENDFKAMVGLGYTSSANATDGQAVGVFDQIYRRPIDYSSFRDYVSSTLRSG